MKLSYAGSSPRVRGRQIVQAVAEDLRRLIPAGAGQTDCAGGGGGSASAHPRGCGADPGFDLNDTGTWGSSPRVRGRQPRRFVRPDSGGLIPAGAGQTVRPWTARRRAWAHPRGCGADRSTRQFHISVWGSSPRVRGRPATATPENPPEGLIPAGAGQTGQAQTQTR